MRLALPKADGGRDGAAAMLDLNSHTLRARMRKLGINWAQFRTRS